MAPLASSQFIAHLSDNDVRFDYTVYQDYAMVVSFTLRSKAYSFNLTRWKGARAQFKFLDSFHSFMVRDETMFGSRIVEEDGIRFDMSVEQRINAVVQGAIDVIFTLNKIVHAFERSVLDYAVWYREKRPQTDTYSQLITLMCCHSIVHSDFMAPGIAYPLVQFADEEEFGS